MKPIARLNPDHWTYGAEHELADWDTRCGLPEGYLRADDWTLVNSNGVAVQPNPLVYRYGGEINTPPTQHPVGQVLCLEAILESQRTCQINHRSNLHVHVRIPGLVRCLPLLKQIQQYIHSELPLVLDLLEPIPVGKTRSAKKRTRRRRVSHHTLLTAHRLEHQLTAKTITTFFEREVPVSKAGRVMWHAQPRLAVNLRQLLQTDTIEFRHFPGTLDKEEMLTCVEWCRDFLCQALDQLPINSLWERYKQRRFPPFPAFDHSTEVRYQATASHNGLKIPEIKHNIRLILEGKFHGSPGEEKAEARACGLSRQHLS